MLRCFLVTAIILSSLASPTPTRAQTDPSETVEFAQERADLRNLRESLVEAIIAGDVEKQVTYAHPDIMTTWQNNDTANGHDGLRSFMEENLSKQKIFQGYTERPTSDVVSLYRDGTVAVAQGRSVPHYKFLGKEFDLENRWSATLLQDDGAWKIVSYHVSGNIADNPLLSAAKSSLIWVAFIGFAIGLIVGVVGMKMTKKIA